MCVALVLLICTAVVNVAVSQPLPTVSPRTETATPPLTKCTLNDKVKFISTLPNAAVCGTSIATIFTPPANDTTALANALKNV